MLEVIFEEAIKASIKSAKSDKKRKALAGNKEDIVNIGFSLDIGDVLGAIDSSNRQEIYKNT